jgi:hypothetical protein
MGSSFQETISRSRREQVVVAMASYQQPRLPAFAKELPTSVVQLHSSEYRNPAQLAKGRSSCRRRRQLGAEVALEAARNGHSTWLSGRDPGHIPFRIEVCRATHSAAPIVLRFVFHHVLTLKTPMGRKAQPKGVPRGARSFALGPRARRRRSPSCSKDCWRSRRAPASRGWSDARRRDCRLVHRFSSRLFVDRLAGVWPIG